MVRYQSLEFVISWFIFLLFFELKQCKEERKNNCTTNRMKQGTKRKKKAKSVCINMGKDYVIFHFNKSREKAFDI